MADNVEIKFGADATKMAREFEKMKDKVASLTNTVEKMGQKTKASSKETASGFQSISNQLSSMATRAVSVAAAYMLIKQGISAVIEKAKELRAIRDESAISTGASTNKINKNFNLDDAGKQTVMRNFVFGQSQHYKEDIDTYSKFVEQVGADNVSKETLYSGKMAPYFKTINAKGIKDTRQFAKLLQTIAHQKGKNLNDMSLAENQDVAELLATQQDEDIGPELNTFISKMPKQKDGKSLPLESILALKELAERESAGKERKTASMIVKGYEEGGLSGAVKATGENMEEYNSVIERNKKDSVTKLYSDLTIQGQSREAEVIYSKNRKKIQFSNSQEGQRLNSSLGDDIQAVQESENMGTLQRWGDDIIRAVIGNKKFLELQEASNKAFYGEKSEDAIIKLNQSVDKNNLYRSNDLGKTPTNTKDSK